MVVSKASNKKIGVGHLIGYSRLKILPLLYKKNVSNMSTLQNKIFIKFIQ